MQGAPTRELNAQDQYLTFISRLTTVDGFVLDALEREVTAQDIVWHEPYSEYASPGLQVAVLMSPDGDENNFSWKDCKEPKQTPLLNRMPVLKRLLEGFGFDIMASRLLRLQPGTYLHEHRDYVYLEEVPRYRLHVPIVTNPKAQIIMPGSAVHLSRGHLWKLNPKEAIHSACNFGPEARIHLMLDCYVNDKLQRLVDAEDLPAESIRKLPILTQSIRSRILDEGRSLIRGRRQEQAEDLVLRQFCHYDLGSDTTYQLMYELYHDMSACEQRLEYWRTRAQDVYPVIAH
jgi:hypothetical protein